MDTFAYSTQGTHRDENQDRSLIKELPGGGLLLGISDGMGSSTGGGIAAEMTMERLSSLADEKQAPQDVMNKMVENADQAVFCKASEDECLEGMGATITAVLVKDGEAYWVHAGDSRMAVFRDGDLEFITRDQNMAWFLYDEGEISVSEVQSHPGLRLLDQCVGCGDCEAESGSFSVEPGALFVLTTDGIHDKITPKALKGILAEDSSLEEKARIIMDLIRKAGSTDDATIVMGRV